MHTSLRRLSIDKSSPVPLYHQVMRGIEDAIRSGELPPGSRLVNEVELAAQHNLSRPTMRRAIEELVRSGLLVRKQGAGTQVVAEQVHRPLELSSLHDDLVRAGRFPGTEVLDLNKITADDSVCDRLHLPAGSMVYHVTRLRTAAGEPLALMENWVRADITSIDEQALTSGGLYDLLRAAGVNFRLALQSIGAAAADRRQAGLLQVDAGAALVTMDRTAIDDAGRHVETGRHVYKADSYSFEMTLVQR